MTSLTFHTYVCRPQFGLITRKTHEIFMVCVGASVCACMRVYDVATETAPLLYVHSSMLSLAEISLLLTWGVAVCAVHSCMLSLTNICVSGLWTEGFFFAWGRLSFEEAWGGLMFVWRASCILQTSIGWIVLNVLGTIGIQYVLAQVRLCSLCFRNCETVLIRGFRI